MEHNHIRILAVDDLFDNLITLKALINESFPNAEVIFALSGHEAIQVAHNIDPDVIFLDVFMPEIDGYQVCKNIKENDALKDIPVVFITAQKSDKTNRIKALEVGAEAFLAKPIDQTELIAQLRAMLKIRESNRKKQDIQVQISQVLSEKTLQLELNNQSTLNLLEDLRIEVENRKKTEQALRKSEARLQRAEMASRMGNWEFDERKGTFTLSKGAMLLLDTPEVEISCEAFMQLFTPNDRIAIADSLNVLLTDHVPFNHELELKLSGKNKPMYLRIVGTYEQNEEKAYGVIRNITQYVIAQKRILESESLYKGILNNSPDNIVILNKTGYIDLICPKTLSTLGYSSDDALVGKHVMDFIHPDDIAYLNAVSNLKSSEIADQTFNFRILHKNAEIIEIEAKVSPIYNELNAVSSIIVVARDVTARNATEKRIRQSEAEFRAVWENSGNALRLSDEHGNILRYNKAFAELFDCNNKVLTKVHDIFIAGKQQNCQENYLINFATGNIEVDKEVEITLHNGVKKWVEVRMSFIELNNAKKLLLTIYNEITARKTVENELQLAMHRYKALLHANPDMMFIFSPDYRIIDFKGDEKLLFTQPQVFLNQKIASYMPNNLATKAMHVIDSVIKTGEVVSFEYNMLINGSIYYFESRYVPFQGNVLSIIRNMTEKVKTEQALAESEVKFRELMDNSPEGITIYIDGIIHYVNKKATQLMRAHHKSELIGRSLFEFIHPDNLHIIKERMKFVAITPINTALPPVEEKYLRLDGTEMDVEIQVMPILYEGKPAIQVTGHDITEKKQTQLEIERSRKELKTIYDNAPIMMCVLNKNAEILFANSALNNFVDVTNTVESIQKQFGNVLGCIHTFNDSKGCGFGQHCQQCTLRMAIKNTFDTGKENKNIEYQTNLDAGEGQKPIAFLASTSLIETETEKHLLLCMVDITARKEAEKSLQKSETLLRSFIDNIPFKIWARDMQGVGVLQNQKCIELHGNILGVTPEDHKQVNLEDAQKWLKINERVYKGETVNQEISYELNGQIIESQHIVFPIRNENEMFGIAGVDIDITEKKKAEKELFDYQKQLKNFASHLQTVREEERMDLAREIHDDLGQVLVAIKFDLGMLGVKSKKHLREESIEEFTKQFKRLESYVNNSIKSARRIMTDLRPELLDMVGLVEAFKEHIQAFNDRQSIVCSFIDNTMGVNLSSDKSVALFRILQESLNNASKHSEATEISVEISQKNNATYLIIKDNGIGFDTTLKKRGDSYGLLGMKERAYLLEGKVDIWSKPGNGVKITVVVPD